MSLEHFDIIFAFAVVMLLLSLVITVTVQFVVAFLGLRGKNLIWGVTKVLERSPTLKDHAPEITKKALVHPALSINGKTAKVIGSKELLAVLHDLASDSNKTIEETAKKKLKEALADVVPQESQYHAEKLAEEFKKLFPNEAAKMEEALGIFRLKTSKLMSDFDTWFDTVMNRCTDRFVAATRFWSVVFAVILALGLQIDSFGLLKNLSTNVEVRSGLVQIGDRTLNRAEEVLLIKHIAVEALESVSSNETFKKEFDTKKIQIPSGLVSRTQGSAWLNEEFKGSAVISQMQKAYEENFEKLTRERLGSLGNQMIEIKNQLELSKLVVLPANWSIYMASWKDFWQHLPGILMSVLLLSLGAPFWFNALRTLASLRPIMAGQADPSKLEKK
jgi:hypothetical protein